MALLYHRGRSTVVATSEREVVPLCAKKIVVRIDRNKADNIGIFMIKNSAVVAGYVDASATGVGFMEGVIIQKSVERFFFKKQQSFVAAIL